MQKTRSVLRFNCPVRFQDRWQGHLAAIEVDADWEVLNVVIARRGLLGSSSVRLPFSVVSDWSSSLLALDCTSEEAFARQIPPNAAPARTLSPRTPVAAPGARLTGALAERASRRVTHLLIARGLVGASHLVPREQVSLEGDAVKLTAPLGDLPLYRSDEDLVQMVRQALSALPYLTGDDRRALQVEAADGVVVLRGNVRTPQGKLWALQAAQSVDGALSVQDQVIDDPHLEIAIGQALERAGLFHGARIYVRSNLGDVTLYGFVPSLAYIEEVLRTVHRVPGVRSVTSRLEIEVPAAAAGAGAAGA